MCENSMNGNIKYNRLTRAIYVYRVEQTTTVREMKASNLTDHSPSLIYDVHLWQLHHRCDFRSLFLLRIYISIRTHRCVLSFLSSPLSLFFLLLRFFLAHIQLCWVTDECALSLSFLFPADDDDGRLTSVRWEKINFQTW